MKTTKEIIFEFVQKELLTSEENKNGITTSFLAN